MIKAIIVLYYMSGFGPVVVETGPMFNTIDECMTHFQRDAAEIMSKTSADGIEVTCLYPEGDLV